MIHRRHGGKIAMRRRRRGGPLERIRFPRIVACGLSTKQAPEKVDDEEELRRKETKGRDAHHAVEPADMSQMRILGVVVNAAGHPGNPQDKHGKHHRIEQNEREGKVNSAKCVIEHAPEHFRKPIGHPSEDAEEAAAEEHVMQVAHNKVRIV